MLTPKLPNAETLVVIKNNYTYDSISGNLFSKRLDRPLAARSDSGYLRISVHVGETVYYIKAHHICWYLHYNEWPSINIDHINNVRTDNRISNLRSAFSQQNSFNARKTAAKTSSSYKGVAWHKVAKKWRSYIALNGKHIHIGLFDSETEAAKAYNSKAMEVFGIYAKTNTIL